MNRKVRKHVDRRAQEWGIAVPGNADEILDRAGRHWSDQGIHVKFRARRYYDNDMLNANAPNIFRKATLLTPEWAANLILRPSEELENAFASTVGHEIGHTVKFWNPLSHLLYLHFCFWLNEVYADFYARKEFLNGDTDAQIRAMRFKRAYRISRFREMGKPEDKADKDCMSHPSRETRIRYIENFDTFDENLVRQIAEDTGCRSRRAIKKACNFYL